MLPPRPCPAGNKAARVAAALRENLRKRKQQARARAAHEEPEEVSGSAPIDPLRGSIAKVSPSETTE